ncbi:MAG: FecR domain-containing protein [Rhodocyclaceae bacterium]|nr:FecR domain-containing protein [Rhodocyclaceae bacterium]
MRHLFVGLCLLLAGFAAWSQNPQPTAAPNLAGKVELVEGDVKVYDKAKKPRHVVVGDSILEGEGIVTGRDGELHIDMEDGGLIAVRPNTRMSIVAYRAEGDDQDKGIFSLLQGTFRSVTGWIGKFNPRSYQVRTPTATIGVRGTDHEPLVIPEGSREGEPGSYDKVNVGGTFIQTRHGSIDVKPNQAGFAPWRGRPVPRLLPQVPAFFKATRHEAVIAARHEAVRKVIDQRREERRKVFQEKKAQLDKQKSERQKALKERRKEQETQHRQKGEERRKEWQEGQQKRQQERATDAEKRRKRFEERQEMRQRERESPGRGHDRPKRNIEREQGPRGGGRGRD